MPVSPVQAAKRAFVCILLRLARQYKVTVAINRDAADKDVLAAYKRVILKAHPDKGGSKERFQELSKARDEWEDFSGSREMAAYRIFLPR